MKSGLLTGLSVSPQHGFFKKGAWLSQEPYILPEALGLLREGALKLFVGHKHNSRILPKTSRLLRIDLRLPSRIVLRTVCFSFPDLQM